MDIHLLRNIEPIIGKKCLIFLIEPHSIPYLIPHIEIAQDNKPKKVAGKSPPIGRQSEPSPLAPHHHVVNIPRGHNLE